MTRFPDLDSLALLTEVASAGSLGKAARARGISQPSASARINALERRLRLAVLERTTRGSRLTPAGELVVDWAAPVLDAASELSASVTALQGERATQLTVAASLSIAEYLLPEWLVRLHAEHPDVAVSLQVANSTDVIAAVRGGQVPLGFIESPDVPTDLAAVTVATDRLVVVVAPDHPWAAGAAGTDGAAGSAAQQISMTTFTATPLLLREPGSGTRQTLAAAVGGARNLAAPALQLSTTTAIRSAALRGSAPAVLSELTVAAELAAGRLVAVEVEGLELGRDLRAIHRPGPELPTPARALVELARRS